MIAGTVTGIVSRASRNVSGGRVNVIKGDYIGFVGDDIYTDDPTAEDALLDLSDQLEAGKYDILLLLAGADTQAQAAQELVDKLSKAYKRTEVIMMDGGQPIYDYIMILS